VASTLSIIALPIPCGNPPRGPAPSPTAWAGPRRRAVRRTSPP